MDKNKKDKKLIDKEIQVRYKVTYIVLQAFLFCFIFGVYLYTLIVNSISSGDCIEKVYLLSNISKNSILMIDSSYSLQLALTFTYNSLGWPNNSTNLAKYQNYNYSMVREK